MEQKIGYTGDEKKSLFSLTFEDLSDFLVQQIDDKKYLKKAPVICN